METFSWYKSYGIRYYQITGTTVVEDCSIPIKEFKSKGNIEGRIYKQ